jgi:hypothetical protein
MLTSFRFFYINLRYTPQIPLKRSVILLKSWTSSTGYFSISTSGSSVTNCRFSPTIGSHCVVINDWCFNTILFVIVHFTLNLDHFIVSLLLPPAGWEEVVVSYGRWARWNRTCYPDTESDFLMETQHLTARNRENRTPRYNKWATSWVWELTSCSSRLRKFMYPSF